MAGEEIRIEVVGMGIKFASDAEDTRLIERKALVNSIWYVYLPGRGSFFVENKLEITDNLNRIFGL